MSLFPCHTSACSWSPGECEVDSNSSDPSWAFSSTNFNSLLSFREIHVSHSLLLPQSISRFNENHTVLFLKCISSFSTHCTFRVCSLCLYNLKIWIVCIHIFYSKKINVKFCGWIFGLKGFHFLECCFDLIFLWYLHAFQIMFHDCPSFLWSMCIAVVPLYKISLCVLCLHT